MFVEMEVDNETWHLVKSTPKVTGFIGSGRNPPPVPEDQVRRITQKSTEGEAQPKPLVQFERGEDIRIIDGPFATMTGKVEDVNQARAKLRVKVSIFGRPTSVELDYTQVERPG
jgi:transcriptional antiterminator NusG